MLLSKAIKELSTGAGGWVSNSKITLKIDVDTKTIKTLDGIVYKPKYKELISDEWEINYTPILVSNTAKEVKDSKLNQGFMWNDIHIACDSSSIAMLSIHKDREFESINLKLDGVFHTLTRVQYDALMVAMAEFVQACFDEEMNANNSVGV